MELARAAARQSVLSAAFILVVVSLGITVPWMRESSRDSELDGLSGTVRVVTVGCGWRRVGSGVVTSDGVLTNRHVVEGAAAVTVELESGRSVTVEQVRSAGWLDLSLLRLDDPGRSTKSTGWASVDARVGDAVSVQGHPGGGRFEVESGRIVSERRGEVSPDPDRLWELDVAVEPGSSGSGVFNTEGELVGLVYAAAFADHGALVMRGRDIRAALRSTELVPSESCDT